MNTKKIADKLQKTAEDRQYWVIKDLSKSELISLADYLDIPFDEHDEDCLLDRILDFIS
jgi:hypothetical protein